jgi:flagellar basal body-associated protein FliL
VSDGLIGLLFAALIAALVVVVVVVETRWAHYAAEHHCVEVARQFGYFYPVYISDGKTTTFYMQYSGDRVTYQCDNGRVTR